MTCTRLHEKLKTESFVTDPHVPRHWKWKSQTHNDLSSAAGCIATWNDCLRSWDASSEGGNRVGGSVKVEATSMRLRCKLIHPPHHFLPRTRAARVFLPNLQRTGVSVWPVRHVLGGWIWLAQQGKMWVQMVFFTFYAYILNTRCGVISFSKSKTFAQTIL